METLDSIRGEGEDVVFSSRDIEKDREYNLRSAEESYQRERMRNAKARVVASEIYLD